MPDLSPETYNAIFGWLFTSINPSYFDVNKRGTGFWPITMCFIHCSSVMKSLKCCLFFLGAALIIEAHGSSKLTVRAPSMHDRFAPWIYRYTWMHGIFLGLDRTTHPPDDSQWLGIIFCQVQYGQSMEMELCVCVSCVLWKNEQLNLYIVHDISTLHCIDEHQIVIICVNEVEIR